VVLAVSAARGRAHKGTWRGEEARELFDWEPQFDSSYYWFNEVFE
jgi:hypothetical protein